MPSPFPGMNPYFEQAAHWQDFHTEFLLVLRRQFVPRIAQDSIILLAEHVFLHGPPPKPRRPLGRLALGLLDAPAEVQLPTQDLERIPFLEIRDRRGGSW